MIGRIENARRLLQSGRLAEAERAFEAALETAPDDIEALNGVALAALRVGDSERAIVLLERAKRADPSDAVTCFHLGKAQEASGRLDEALGSYHAAVDARPEFFVARLAYAAALEQHGEAERALIQYARSLKDAQSQGRWTNPRTTPVALQPLVEHAVRAFRAARRRLFEQLCEPLRERYGAGSLTRVEKCLRIYLREEPLERGDPRQQPTFLYFPDLPATPWLSRDELPWVERLEACTPEIRRELLEVLPSERGREPVFTNAALERQNLRGAGASPAWNGYYFWRHGERRDTNCERCPATAAALAVVPLAQVRGHAPEVLFSVFAPGTHLLPHRGVTNTRIVAHLPLLVPDDSVLSVAGEVHAWQEGRIVAFDDTYEHEAWNRSTTMRVVLILDVWNPHLSDVERLAVADLVAAVGDLREDIAQASGS